MTLPELISRLEKSTGPDRELDAHIWCAIFGPKDAWVEQSPLNGAWCVCETRRFGKNEKDLVHHKRPQPSTQAEFTSSIDAARRLVPKGYAWGLSWSKQYALEAWVRDEPGRTTCHQGYAPEGDNADDLAALALSIAALKAHVSREEGK